MAYTETYYVVVGGGEGGTVSRCASSKPTHLSSVNAPAHLPGVQSSVVGGGAKQAHQAGLFGQWWIFPFRHSHLTALSPSHNCPRT
jgi:hypothetical protein